MLHAVSQTMTSCSTGSGLALMVACQASKSPLLPPFPPCPLVQLLPGPDVLLQPMGICTSCFLMVAVEAVSHLHQSCSSQGQAACQARLALLAPADLRRRLHSDLAGCKRAYAIQQLCRICMRLVGTPCWQAHHAVLELPENAAEQLTRL